MRAARAMLDRLAPARVLFCAVAACMPTGCADGLFFFPTRTVYRARGEMPFELREVRFRSADGTRGRRFGGSLTRTF